MDQIILAALAFGIPLILNLLFTPIIIKIADRYQIYDRLNHRKIHQGNISRLGGVGFFLAFALGTFVMLSVFHPVASFDLKILLPLVGGVLVFGVGLWDDFYELRARIKLLVQIVAAVFLLLGGYWFASVGIPGFHAYLDLGVVGLVISFGWILGITNAINLIDGMDGLAGGTGLVASLALGALSFATGRVLPGIFALVMAGALLGFLAYNRPKARIFMGDGGAYFLGFILALIPLIDVVPKGVIKPDLSWFPDGRISILHAITIILIPIADTIAAFIRRARKGQALFEPDRFHMHHKMLGMGMSTWQVLLIVTGIEIVLAAVVLFDVLAGTMFSAACLAASWILVLAFFIYLDRVQYRVQTPDSLQ